VPPVPRRRRNRSSHQKKKENTIVYVVCVYGKGREDRGITVGGSMKAKAGREEADPRYRSAPCIHSRDKEAHPWC
jgi:hypothetical protein